VIDKVKKELPYAPIYGPNVYVPYPGTELFEEAVKMGFTPPVKLEGWINFEGWTFANAPWVPPYMESMLDVSRIYFRLGECFLSCVLSANCGVLYGTSLKQPQRLKERH
jgi:hypothetical protein